MQGKEYSQDSKTMLEIDLRAEQETCNNQHFDSSRCSHVDSTPFILPFP